MSAFLMFIFVKKRAVILRITEDRGIENTPILMNPATNDCIWRSKDVAIC